MLVYQRYCAPCPMDRRHFLHTLALAASAPAFAGVGHKTDARVGPLRSDPNGILDDLDAPQAGAELDADTLADAATGAADQLGGDLGMDFDPDAGP